MAKWAGEERLDKAYGITTASKGRRNSQFARVHETSCGEESRFQRDQADKKTMDLPPLELEILEAAKTLTMEIRRDCKTIVDWINVQPS